MALVRSAALIDAPALGRIGVAAWRAAYRGIISDEYLDGLSVEQRTESWRRGLALPVEDGQARLVVEADDGEVVGFVVTGPTRSGEGTGEVQVLNVDPSYCRRGFGGLLLTAAENELRTAGFGAAVLWVVEGNARARGFYESAHWRPDGGRKVDDRFGTGVVEMRYRLMLVHTPDEAEPQ